MPKKSTDAELRIVEDLPHKAVNISFGRNATRDNPITILWTIKREGQIKKSFDSPSNEAIH